MSRLTGDGHAATSLGDDLAHLFQQDGSAIQIDIQDGFDGGLTGRDSCRVHQIFDGSIFPRLVNDRKDGFARREVGRHRHRVESRLIKQVGRCPRVLQAFVADNHFFAGGYSPYDGESDLSGSHPDNGIFSHRLFLFLTLFAKVNDPPFH